MYCIYSSQSGFSCLFDSEVYSCHPIHQRTDFCSSDPTHSTIKMPNVIHEVKLDFKDVLLRPKRSSIRSRADVEIRRKFTFLHSKRVHEGVPIIASNMDTVGTFEMAAALAKV